jgi:uncharacterized cysteine cluster protein YcgN (CxxCxxCC family)
MSQELLEPFPCNSCGKCCSNVNLSKETRGLDRGDGICRYLNMESKKCIIYDTRPDICRIELQYRKNYSLIYTWRDFTELNLEICEKLPSRI